MGLISDSIYMDILVILITGFVSIITYFKWAFKYWERKDMPYLKPSIPFGTLSNILWKPQSFAEMNERQYNESKAKGYKHVGLFIFARPFYMPIDPEYVRNIMSKDFNHFVDRGVYFNDKDDPLSAHLFTIEGTKWRNLRVKLTPTFTSGKMKMMFPILVECGNQLQNAVADICTKKEPTDIRDVVGRYTTDVIGSCAFGLDCNSFKEPNSDFRRYSKRVFLQTKLEALGSFFGFSAPSLARFWGIRFTPKEVEDFFMKIIKGTVDYREKNNFARKDFMQLLIDLKNNVKSNDGEDHGPDDGKGLSFEDLAAQAFIFFLAGYETSSTTMTFCLFELAVNQEIQEKVRDEINTVLEKHKSLTYDAVMEMKYMGQVIDETLRKYPPLPVLNRKCVKQYKMPGTNLIIEEGTGILIPVIGLHHDEEYFPNPDIFDPERFSDANKSKMNPFTYLPFGEGPRNCIGLRFGIMQTKVGLAVLLKNYRFALNKKTQVPLKMNPLSFILLTLGDIWLNVSTIGE